MLQPLRITKIIEEAPGARSFVFADAQIAYQPGQFLTFVFRKQDGAEDRRSYSISCTPREPLQVTVKRVANGAYSRWFTDHAKEGDTVYTTGASGFFVLPEDAGNYQSIVFFAAGSGITPVLPMIKTVLADHPPVLVQLVYSSSSPETTIFYTRLQALQAEYPDRLLVNYLFSAPHLPGRSRLNVARIAELAIRYRHNSLFYLCGPLEYMRTITIVLRTEGIGEHRIRKEIFHIEKPPVKELPPDALPHFVETELNGELYRFEVAYPSTILQTAKLLGIPMPYSCEAGQCGTCAATCLKGNVWMWHNDVLLEEEIEKGRVLTCTGYPVGGDVTLRF